MEHTVYFLTFVVFCLALIVAVTLVCALVDTIIEAIIGTKIGDCHYHGVVAKDGARVGAVYDKRTHTLTFVGSGAIADTRKWLNAMSESQRKYVEHVIITSGITGIASGALSAAVTGFVNLQTVNIMADLSYIESGAFANNPGLERLTFNEHTCHYIGDGAFIGCHSLGKVKLPPDTTLGSSVFPDTAEVA